MSTAKIVKKRNDNVLKRIVMDIKDKKPLYFNPKFNPNDEVYNQKIRSYERF